MSNLDQCLGAFAERFASQTGDSVFGHHVIHIVARGCDRGAFGQCGYDPRSRTVFCRRRHGHDAFSASRPHAATYIIYLTARPADLLQANALRRNLTGKIDRKTTVDADHPIVLRNYPRVIHILRRIHLHVGVMIHKVIQRLRPHQERCHHFIRM